MSKVDPVMTHHPDKFFIDSAHRTVDLESNAIFALHNAIGDSFAKACRLILATSGRVVVTGMGKSGHIAGKIASTLASTGTPAFFLHPAEASHGDMGMITRDDCVIALSNSGGTQEIVTLLPLIKRINVPLISITGNSESDLAAASDVHLLAAVDSEACPLDLAPTSSTSVALVLGDAMSIAVLEARGFTAEEFAFSHPGGALGRRLLLRVGDVMASGNDTPKIAPTAMIVEALYEMTGKGLGMTTVVTDTQQLAGIFTDGDLRRVMEDDLNLRETPVAVVMTTAAKTVTPDTLAAEALGLMERLSISSLIVTDHSNQLLGVITLLALLKEGIS